MKLKYLFLGIFLGTIITCSVFFIVLTVSDYHLKRRSYKNLETGKEELVFPVSKTEGDWLAVTDDLLFDFKLSYSAQNNLTSIYQKKYFESLEEKKENKLTDDEKQSLIANINIDSLGDGILVLNNAPVSFVVKIEELKLKVYEELLRYSTNQSIQINYTKQKKNYEKSVMENQLID